MPLSFFDRVWVVHWLQIAGPAHQDGGGRYETVIQHRVTTPHKKGRLLTRHWVPARVANLEGRSLPMVPSGGGGICQMGQRICEKGP